MPDNPYRELEQFQSKYVRVYNDYHGTIPRFDNLDHPKVIIYSCFGEAANLTWLDSIFDRKPDAYFVLISTRHYAECFPYKDRCRLITLPSAYAYYSRIFPQINPIPTSKTILKHFLSLNNRGQWQRQALFQFLYKFNLLQYGYFSYHCHPMKGNNRQRLYQETNDIIGNTWFNQSLNLEELYQLLPLQTMPDTFKEKNESLAPGYETLAGNVWGYSDKKFYENCFCSIVTETYIDENNDAFFTEKVFKPLAYGHPLLLLSSAGALKLLQALGFETFPDVFDESYDNQTSPQLRFEHIFREIIKLCNLTASDLEDLHQMISPRLNHNQEWFFHELPTKYDREISVVKKEIKEIIKEHVG